jgi:triosephosphate isomerase (TIM)
MRKKFVAGNWKMNNTIADARQLVTELVLSLKLLDGIDLAICPSYLAAPIVANLLEGTGIGVGVQNLFWEESGAYTGEISAQMVAEVCQYVIVGHSERRQYFGESDKSVSLRVKAALEAGVKPIVCVGESLEENQSGQTTEVLSRQVRGALYGLTRKEGANLVVAYEPIWAIGTGLAATPEDANAIHKDVVRPALEEIFGDEVAQAIQIQYGGSVKPDNAAAYFSQSDIDGALVGGAALNAESFTAIAKAAAEA